MKSKHYFEKIVIVFIFFVQYSAFMYELGKRDARNSFQQEAIETACEEINNIIEPISPITASVEPIITKTTVKPTPKVVKRTVAKKSHKYAISTNGMDFIKELEGCELTAYPDANGYSIGYGHHTKSVYKGMVITQEQADEYFAEDIAWVNDAINKLLDNIDYEFNQNFIDGFASLMYNCGEGGIKSSTFYKTLSNKCRWNASNDIIQKDLAYTLNLVKQTRITHPVHKTRRKAEYKLMTQL